MSIESTQASPALRTPVPQQTGAARTATEESDLDAGDQAQVDESAQQTQDQYAAGRFKQGDAAMGKTASLAQRLGMAGTDIDALVREALQGRRDAADGVLLNMTNLLKDKTDQQTSLTRMADSFSARGAEEKKSGPVYPPGTMDAREIVEFSTRASPDGKTGSAAGWVTDIAKAQETHGVSTYGELPESVRKELRPPKAEIEQLAKEYSNAASSMGADIQALTLKLQTAKDQRDESTDMLSSWQKGGHDTTNKIIGNL